MTGYAGRINDMRLVAVMAVVDIAGRLDEVQIDVVE